MIGSASIGELLEPADPRVDRPALRHVCLGDLALQFCDVVGAHPRSLSSSIERFTLATVFFNGSRSFCSGRIDDGAKCENEPGYYEHG